MSAILASLGGIALTMGLKIVGYSFISKALIISLRAWAETTESKHDDEIIEAMAAALEVPVSNLK